MAGWLAGGMMVQCAIRVGQAGTIQGRQVLRSKVYRGSCRCRQLSIGLLISQESAPFR